MVVQYEQTCTPFKFLELCRCSTVGVWLRNCSSPRLPRPCSFSCATEKREPVKRRKRSSRSVGTSVAFDENKDSQVLNKRSGTVFDLPPIPNRRQTLPNSNPSPFSSKSRRGRRRNDQDNLKQVFYHHEAESLFSSSPVHSPRPFNSERQFNSTPLFDHDQHLSCAESVGGSLSGSRYPEYYTSWGYNQNALLLYQSSIQSKWHTPYLSDGCAPEPRQNNLSPSFELQSAPNLVENFCKHHDNQLILSRTIASSQPAVKYERQKNRSSDKRSVADSPDDGGGALRNSGKDIYNRSTAPISSSTTCARYNRQWKVCENHQKQHNITSSNFGHWHFNQALTAAATTESYLSPSSSHFSTQGEPEEHLMISSVQSLPENNTRAYNMNKQIDSFQSDRRFEHAVQIPFGGSSRYSFHNPDFNYPRRPTSRAPSLNKHQTVSSLPPVEENFPISQPSRQAASENEFERRTSAAFLSSRELPHPNSRRTNSLVTGSALKGSRDQVINASCPAGDHLVGKCINCLCDPPNSNESTSIWKLRQPPPPSKASNDSWQNNESTECSAPRENNASRSYRLVAAPPTKGLPKKPSNVYQQTSLFNTELDFQSPVGDKRTSKSPARLIASSSRFTPSKTTTSGPLSVQKKPQQHTKSSQDIWVRQAELAVKETDILSASESSSSVIEGELEMAPQRSFKIIDPCLHSPIHPAYRTADMKQSRTSVSIQNDSYNFGPPNSRAMGGITTTQSISGLDSYNSENPESEEILPLNELYSAWGSDVDDIVTSYEKLDIEEKTSPRSKFNDVWTGKNQMKPPPFKTAVASLNSLRMSSNFNLSDYHGTGDYMTSQNIKRIATSLVDINEKSSNSPHIVTTSKQSEQAKIDARKPPSSNLFTTQSELNVTGNRKESIPQNSLKNCRSELLLAETLTSVKNLSLRPRDRSKPNFTRSSSQKTKSSNDISSISELTISDEFTRGLTRSKYRQSSTSSSHIRSTSLHSDDVKEENEETVEESVETNDKKTLQNEKPTLSSLHAIQSSSSIHASQHNELLNDDNTESLLHESVASSYHDGAITITTQPSECRNEAMYLRSGSALEEENNEEDIKLCEEDGAKSNVSIFECSSSPPSNMPSTNSSEVMDTTSISSTGTVHNIAPAIQAVSDALSSLESISFRPEKTPRGVSNQNCLTDQLLIDMMDEPSDQTDVMAVPDDKIETGIDLCDFGHSIEIEDEFGNLSNSEFASIEEYPEFTGEENQRDLSIAFAEFASAISDLITIADTDKPLQNYPLPQSGVKKKPKPPKIQTSPIHSSPEAYDVTPTNEREDDTKLKHHSSPKFTNYNSLYADLDMKVDEFLQNCPPGKSIEFLLEKLTRPKSIQIYQKLIGRSKSLPGSLNETANVGKLRPLRVPRHLKSHWDARLRRRSPESKKSVNLEFVGENMIPRRHKSKRKFLRDDPDRCKSVPLTKVEIHCLSDHINTDGISSLPSVTNINELGLYEYVDVDSELNFSMQKMFVNSPSSSSSSQDACLSSNRPLTNPETFHPFQSTVSPTGHLPTLLENPILDSNSNSAINTSNSEPISKPETIQERLSTSAASTCANVDVSQLIFELCNSDDYSDDYPYDDDDEGGGIRDPDPTEFADNDEFKDEYFASELIEPQSYQISPKQFQTSLNGLTSQQHPPPVLPFMANARQIIERSATYPRTLDEIAECANE